MVEKMRFVSFVGKTDDIDRIAEQYVLRREIQLEPALKEFGDEERLVAFSDHNYFEGLIKGAEKLVKRTGVDPASVKKEMGAKEAESLISFAQKHFDEIFDAASSLKKQRYEVLAALSALAPFARFNIDISRLRGMTYVRYKFGKLPSLNYTRLKDYVYREVKDVLFVKSEESGGYVYGVWFAPETEFARISGLLSSYHFEEIAIPENVGGKPLTGVIAEDLARLKAEDGVLEKEIAVLEAAIMDATDADERVTITKTDIVAAYNKLKDTSRCFDVRNYAAQTESGFYVLVGWATPEEADIIAKDTANDDDVLFTVEEPDRAMRSSPPIKLRNKGFVKPFEFFVRLYGLPNYGELDPTAFLALTYTMMFGFMFGDIGQGLVLSLLGVFLWKKKKFALGRIMTVVGVSAAFFGLMFGSVFGFEFNGLWISPGETENVNTLLLTAVGIGVFLVFMSIAMAMASALKTRKFKRKLLEPNGPAGALFYAGVLIAALTVLIQGKPLSPFLIVFFIVLPILLMATREFFTALVLDGRTKAKEHMEAGVGMFAMQSFIEAFDIVLAFFTNTISFVRVGAFALSHASMMGVVVMLSQTAHGTHNPIVIIIGNLFVMTMEGFLVGIQVLRLEFYEMFSRFYKGEGRSFSPYNKSN